MGGINVEKVVNYSGCVRSSLAGCIVAVSMLAGCSTGGAGVNLTASAETPSIMLSLARTSDEIGDYTLAAEYYGRVIASGDASSRVWQRQGELLLKLGAVRNARAHYTAALRAGVDNAEIRRGYGRALVRVNEASLALKQFDRAIQMEPENFKAMNGRGVALDMLGRHIEAQSQYMQVQELAPFDIAAQNNLALSYTLAGNADKAVDMLESVYLAGQSTVQHRQNLALLYGLTGQSDKAVALSNMDLRPELVARNQVAYANLRQKYQQGMNADSSATVQASSIEIQNEDVSVVTVEQITSPAPMQATRHAVMLPPLQVETSHDIGIPADVQDEPVVKVTKTVPQQEVAFVSKGAATVVARAEVANMPLMAEVPDQVTLRNVSIAPEANVLPEIRVVGLFNNQLTAQVVIPQEGVKPVQVASKVRVPRPAYERLADLELASMNIEHDAFGNALRILPGRKPVANTPRGPRLSQETPKSKSSLPLLVTLGGYAD